MTYQSLQDYSIHPFVSSRFINLHYPSCCSPSANPPLYLDNGYHRQQLDTIFQFLKPSIVGDGFEDDIELGGVQGKRDTKIWEEHLGRRKGQ